MDITTFAQLLSFVGLAFIVFSYQQKIKSRLILCQLAGCGVFSIHYLLMGAYAGFLLNAIGMVRSIVFYKEDRSKKTGNIWTGILIALFVAAYILTFALFKTPATTSNLILEVLPTIGMCILTISFNMTGTAKIRALGTMHSICWMIYNIAHVSIGGIACESMCMISIIIGFFRYDVKKKVRE